MQRALQPVFRARIIANAHECDVLVRVHDIMCVCCHVSAVLVKSRTDSDTLHVLDDSIECNVYAEKGFRKRTSVF